MVVIEVVVDASADTEVRKQLHISTNVVLLEELKTDLCFSHRIDDDDFDRRAPRRRYEEPLGSKVRRQLLLIAESVCAFSPCTGYMILFFLLDRR